MIFRVKSFIACCCLFFLSLSLQAGTTEKFGFLWSNLPKDKVEQKQRKKIRRIPLNQLSYQMQSEVLRYYTMEMLHKAINTHDVAATEQFIAMQNYGINQAAAFQHNFQYALLRHPEYDYTVNNPTSSIGSKLNAEREESLTQRTIAALAKHYGFLFFYKGNDVYSQKQASVLQAFATRHQFNFLSISVDGVLLPTLSNNRIDKGQAKQLNVTHYPTIVLVHPKTKRVLPVSHGFVTQDYLTQQIMVVAKQLQREQQGEGVLYD